MTNEAVVTESDDAAALLFSLARAEVVVDALPPALEPYAAAAPDDGLALQTKVIERWRALGQDIGGWKVAWTSRAMRDSGGKDFRPFGYILASRMFPTGSTVSREGIYRGQVESEICLTIGSRLSGEHVTRDEAFAAVESVSPAFEINARRLANTMPLACRIGNGLNNWGLVVGPAGTPPDSLDGIVVEQFRDGEPAGAGRTGEDILDDPYLSLARVVTQLSRHGFAIEPGQRIITGSILPGMATDGVGHFEASFGDLGSVAVDLV
ncbi:MAG TPA: fumarylacetoacetate hydrolase family protein [Micromonosporaceae bacterium]|nr:fumarylacetoacetate hydrolase family protein [Micromonosporaceae bacterium]